MSYDEDWSGWLRSGLGLGGNTASLIGGIGGKSSRLKVLPLRRTIFWAITSELRKGGGGGKIVDLLSWEGGGRGKIVDCLSWEEGLEDLDSWFWKELIKGKLKLGGSGLRNGTRMFGCKALEWDSEKEAGEFVPAVDHLREFEHRGCYRNPILAFPEAEVLVHQGSKL